MPQHKQIQLVGIAIFVLGAILLAVGTTSQGLFIVYGLIAIAGALIVGYSTKLRDKR